MNNCGWNGKKVRMSTTIKDHLCQVYDMELNELNSFFTSENNRYICWIIWIQKQVISLWTAYNDYIMAKSA